MQLSHSNFFFKSLLGGSLLLGIASSVMLLSQPTISNPTKDSPKAAALLNFIKMPLSFEINKGQTSNAVKYLARGNGYITYFTPQEIVMAFSATQPHPVWPDKLKFVNESQHTSNTVLRLQFVGANNPVIVGMDEQLNKSNYLIGNDPKKWHKNIANYGKVNYQNLYSGIDMVFYGDHKQLEYDIRVAPGANPLLPRFHIEGANSIATNSQGDLVLTASRDEKIIMHKPIVYQMIAGVKHFVSGNFKIANKNQIGFEVGAYDKTHTLVIDPAIIYSSFVGGTGGDNALLAIALDNVSQPNVYVTGYTNSTDFPTTAGAYQTTRKGQGRIAFVSKIAPTGTSFLYSTYLGGTGGDDEGFAIAVDRDQSAYITGETNSKDFPTKNPFQATNKGARFFSAFVTKLNPEGSDLTWSTYLGGSGSIQVGKGIVVDAQGYAYVTGTTNSNDFPLKSAFQKTNKGRNFTAYVTKFRPTGDALLFSTYFGGSGGFDEANGIAFDGVDVLALVGDTNSKNFPLLNPLQKNPPQNHAKSKRKFRTGWVAEMTRDGVLTFSTYLGGSGNLNYPTAVDIGPFKEIFVAGFTDSKDFPLLHAIQTANKGPYVTGFVTSIEQNGARLLFSTYLGGSGGNDRILAVKTDSASLVHLTGFTNSADFPIKNAIQSTKLGGGNTAFVTLLSESGSLLQSTYYGGSGTDDRGYGIAIDSLLNQYIVGSTTSTDFPVVSPIQNAKPSARSGWFAKLSP